MTLECDDALCGPAEHAYQRGWFFHISNAIKFSPGGSDIEITYTQGRGRKHTVTICDRGPGIPEEDLEEIFER
ncbi:MAG: sensor histidine kinase [Deltaproteobacteria bacterium]|nr:sensor histidine kinase [Deltaproteobacteria bacterium]